MPHEFASKETAIYAAVGAGLGYLAATTFAPRPSVNTVTQDLQTKQTLQILGLVLGGGLGAVIAHEV